MELRKPDITAPVRLKTSVTSCCMSAPEMDTLACDTARKRLLIGRNPAPG
jgi:hypothetical protein